MLSRYEGQPVGGRLVYRRSECSLDVEPIPAGGVAALLVNDVQIEIDEDGRLIFVWGLCPRAAWITASLQPPGADAGRLQLVGGTVIPGVSRRLNPVGRWAVFHDPGSRWLCIGRASGTGDGVAFAPGAIAQVDGGELIALWLRPEMRD